MRRLPALAFAALVAATIAAFFITQHLKVSDPLIASFRTVPGSINPVDGRTCELRPAPKQPAEPTSFRRTKISFFLPDHSDDVGVFIVNAAGEVVRTIRWRQMHVGKRAVFVWNGRESNGTVAPDGTYFVKVALQQEGRAFDVTDHAIHIVTTSPVPKVRSVVVTPTHSATSTATSTTTTTGATTGTTAVGSVAGTTTGAPGAVVLTPPDGTVTVRFTPRSYRDAELVIYRTRPDGHLDQVGTVAVHAHGGVGTWNGTLDGRPAPPGTYLIGVRVTDQACNLGSFPATNPAVISSTAHTGVTVSYLAVEPQLYPVPAGSDATVYVDSHGAAYTWVLRRPGTRRSLLHGQVSGGASPLNVRVPGASAGLYVLTVRSAGRSVTVPVVASAPAGARVLVVLPALTWQGENPVDDTGDGIPDTLAAGDRIELDRPLVDGLPGGFTDEAALLQYLEQLHMHYQLTTDVALALGTGPSLEGHPGVILDGSFSWLPSGLAGELRTYVAGGGHLLALGIGSLQAQAPVNPSPARSATGPTAGPPKSTRLDPFGAQHGAVQPVSGALITELSDPLRIFGPASAFTGFSEYQTIEPPAGTKASLAGVGAPAPAIAGFPVARGTVVEVGLNGFGANLQRDESARDLLARVWKQFKR